MHACQYLMLGVTLCHFKVEVLFLSCPAVTYIILQSYQISHVFKWNTDIVYWINSYLLW